MRKYWYLAAAPAAAAIAILAITTPASADGNVITVGSAGGAAANVGDVATANLASGTTANFFSSATGTSGAKCATSTLTASVTSNPAAPGTATESLTGQTFSSCTANVFGVNKVNSVVVQNLAYVTSISSGGNVTVAGSSAPIQTTISLATVLGNVTCVYQSTNTSGISGVSSNADSSITLTNQSFTKTSGPNLCFATAFLSARYAPVTINGQPAFTN
jgi:hypothetical protein